MWFTSGCCCAVMERRSCLNNDGDRKGNNLPQTSCLLRKKVQITLYLHAYCHKARMLGLKGKAKLLSFLSKEKLLRTTTMC